MLYPSAGLMIGTRNVLDDNQILTECVAIIQYLADRKPEAKLAPVSGTLERYRLAECLNFLATELHRGFSPLFNPSLPEPMRAATLARLDTRLAHVDRRLDGRPYLLGDTFTVADAYLFTITTWLPYVKLDLAKWPHLAAHYERVKKRPAVDEALRVEADLRAA